MSIDTASIVFGHFRQLAKCVVQGLAQPTASARLAARIPDENFHTWVTRHLVDLHGEVLHFLHRVLSRAVRFEVADVAAVFMHDFYQQAD